MRLAKDRQNNKRFPAPVSKTSPPARPMQRWQREVDRLLGDPFGDWVTPKGPRLGRKARKGKRGK